MRSTLCLVALQLQGVCAWLQACQDLEQLLAEDQYLSTRVDKITIDTRQKAAYSVYRCAS